jgi:hypothetical protein
VKKLAVFLFIIVLLAGTVFAQNRDNRPNRNDRNQGPQPSLKGVEPEVRGSPLDVTKVTIEGLLKLEKGIVAVESGGSVYYVPKLNRYIGFIEGLKEGTKVSVEGSQFNGFISPEKVTINGKSYDFPGYGSRDNDNRFSPGRNNFRQPRYLNNRGWQARPYGRNGFGGCCR